MRNPSNSQEKSHGTRRDFIAQLSAPMRDFLREETGSAGMLIGATALALFWANSPWSKSYEDLKGLDLALRIGNSTLTTNPGHLINNALMALFFFVIGLEVRHELSVGELTHRRRVLVPALAGVTGMIVPALLYLALNRSGAESHGWGIVIGSDTAFLLGALALVGPKFSTQLRIFLLTLTVIDDIFSVAVIGIVYSHAIRIIPLVIAMGALVSLMLLSKFNTWRSAPYIIGLFTLWIATVSAGLHASIAGMLGGLAIAARAPVREAVEGAASRFSAFRQSPLIVVGKSARRGLQKAISINERLMSALHPWTGNVILPLFALANAGIDLRKGVLSSALSSSVTWAVVLGLVLGKFLGISGGALIGVRVGLGKLPQGVKSAHVMGGAALSGIGFTVSLLIINLAFDDRILRDQATVGVLIAMPLATLLGWAIFWFAARFRGESEADLPRILDRDVDVSVDHIRGPISAPLTLVEYGDFECPFCAKATGTAREIRQRFGDDLRYVFRHLPLVDVHPHAELAARAAVAADQQEKFWEMHDLLFAHQDKLEYQDLLSYAAQLELNIDQFAAALQSEEVATRVRMDVESAEASGARGTPTFFIDNNRHIGPYDTETLSIALEASRGPR